MTGPPWLDGRRDGWLEGVSAWGRQVLEDRGLELLAVESVKEMPWGAVLRLRTASERFYFKALGPRGRHELPLLVDIGARSTGLVPQVLAADHDAGWLVMPDHGTAVADEPDPFEQLGAIESLLPAYASLQRSTTPLVDGWSAASVPDRSPRRLPERLAQLLAGGSTTGPLPIHADDIERYHGVLGSLERVCEQLVGADVPLAIDHADIHGTNVLVGDGAPRLIDWGDACISHPFSSLLVPLEWVAGRLPRDDQARAVRRLRDAYAEGWGAPLGDEELGFAVWVGYVARALSNDEQGAIGIGTDHHHDGHHREIVALLRAWSDKVDVLERPEELLMPTLAL